MTSSDYLALLSSVSCKFTKHCTLPISQIQTHYLANTGTLSHTYSKQCKHKLLHTQAVPESYLTLPVAHEECWLGPVTCSTVPESYLVSASEGTCLPERSFSISACCTCTCTCTCTIPCHLPRRSVGWD